MQNEHNGITNGVGAPQVQVQKGHSRIKSEIKISIIKSGIKSGEDPEV